jgi:hypothetical protein
LGCLIGVRPLPGTPISFVRLQAPSPDDAWFLGGLTDAAGREVEAWYFTRGQPAPALGPLQLRIEHTGRVPDFSFGAFGLPVAREATARHLASLAPGAVERVPVQIAGTAEAFEIVNITARVAALDEVATIGGKRSDGSGWLYVATPAVRTARAAGHPLFRLDEFRPIVIVAEGVQRALAAQGWTGFEFLPVLAATQSE